MRNNISITIQVPFLISVTSAIDGAKLLVNANNISTVSHHGSVFRMYTTDGLCEDIRESPDKIMKMIQPLLDRK